MMTLCPAEVTYRRVQPGWTHHRSREVRRTLLYIVTANEMSSRRRGGWLLQPPRVAVAVCVCAAVGTRSASRCPLPDPLGAIAIGHGHGPVEYSLAGAAFKIESWWSGMNTCRWPRYPRGMYQCCSKSSRSRVANVQDRSSPPTVAMMAPDGAQLRQLLRPPRRPNMPQSLPQPRQMRHVTHARAAG